MGQMGKCPPFSPKGDVILYDSFMNQNAKDMNQSDLILNVLIDEFDEGYSPEFKEECGIIDVISLNRSDRGYEEIKIIFKDKESKDKYIEEFDIEIF